MIEVNILAGHKGSGKTTVIEIVNTFGFYATELSVQWKYLEALGFERGEREGEWSIGVISLVYENLLRRTNISPIFMSGFSRPIEIDFLQDKGFNCTIIEVTADTNIRYQRTIQRARGREAEISIEEFNESDLRRLGQVDGYRTNNLNGLLSLASCKIDNNGSIEELVRQVKNMLKSKGYLR